MMKSRWNSSVRWFPLSNNSIYIECLFGPGQHSPSEIFLPITVNGLGWKFTTFGHIRWDVAVPLISFSVQDQWSWHSLKDAGVRQRWQRFTWVMGYPFYLEWRFHQDLKPCYTNGPPSINCPVDQGRGRGTVCFLHDFSYHGKENSSDLFHEAVSAILPWIEKSFGARILEWGRELWVTIIDPQF